MAQNYILLQAYGNKDILNEAIFMMLTFYVLPVRPEVTFVIYTDDVSYFDGHVPEETRFELLNTEILKAWKGPTDFVHRVKIEVIKDFFTKYQGNMLYMDTDTTFIADPTIIFERIEQGEVYMHTCEGRLDTTKNLVFKKLLKFFKGKTFKINPVEVLSIPPSTYMWNAGVLGFDNRQEATINQVLCMTDVLHKQYRKFVMEQFAFSFMLQTAYGVINAADAHIFHYWNFKEFRLILADFLHTFKHTEYAQLVTLSTQLRPEQLIQPKRAFEALPKWKRQLKKILRQKTWEMPEYQFWK